MMVAACALAGPVSSRDAELRAQAEARSRKVASLGPVNLPLPQVVVRLKHESQASAVALLYGLTLQSRFVSDGRWAVFAANDVGHAERSAEAMQGDPMVAFAAQSMLTPTVKDAFTPNDPYFFPNAPTAGWPGQWNLKNTVNTDIDINVEPAWNADVTGLGIIVGIVDDGLQTNHPDFQFNYSSSSSFDFGQNDATPSPVFIDDNHGTAVAGIIAARGGNSVGITGAAPRSPMGGLRLDFSSVNFSTQAADAANYKSGNAVASIRVKNHSYGPISPYNSSAVETAAVVNSTGLGTIHVRSAGNGRGTTGEDVNKYTERNIPETIVVGAIGSDGKFLTSSNYGASLTCVAPSSSVTALNVILTTDRTLETDGFNGGLDTFSDGNYTSQLGYTSAAAPAVTGGIALLKQEASFADTRFVKHLLARTSFQCDAADATAESDGGWTTNAAGIKFNQNYGFGLMNVGSMLTLAAQYEGVTALNTATSGTVNVAAAIPDNNTTGLSRTFTINQSTPLEELLVTMNITHTWRGDLRCFVTSPSGTKRRLFNAMLGDNGAGINWTFSSNAFWGENPNGTWTIQVVDTAGGDTGTWNSFAATARMGELDAITTTISGAIELQEWVLDEAGKTVNFRLVPTGGGSATVVPVVLGAGGAYNFATDLFGSYDLYAKGDRWLTKKIGTVVLNGTILPAQNASLINGDIDNNDVIQTDDYLGLSTYFDTDESLPDWLVPDGNGYIPERSDLNGDGAVTTDDYLILSNNFDLAGDE